MHTLRTWLSAVQGLSHPRDTAGAHPHTSSLHTLHTTHSPTHHCRRPARGIVGAVELHRVVGWHSDGHQGVDHAARCRHTEPDPARRVTWAHTGTHGTPHPTSPRSASQCRAHIHSDPLHITDDHQASPCQCRVHHRHSQMSRVQNPRGRRQARQRQEARHGPSREPCITPHHTTPHHTTPHSHSHVTWYTLSAHLTAAVDARVSTTPVWSPVLHTGHNWIHGQRAGHHTRVTRTG